MFARPKLLLKHALSIFFLSLMILSLMILSAMLPAHFSWKSSGHWVDVCTQNGVTQVWQSDAAQAPAQARNEQTIKAPAFKDLLHTQHQPNCPWCLLSLPTLSLWIVFWFAIAALSNILTPQPPTRRFFMAHHWRWPDPRPPPMYPV